MLKKTLPLLLSLLPLFVLSACDENSQPRIVIEDPPVESGIDTDGDGLTDLIETDGWRVTIYQLNGEILHIDVNSDPRNPDTDGDGVNDALEKSSLTDPRHADTDSDFLTDSQELFEIYSSPYSQDSDDDGLPDGLEFNFHRTSPISADSDGDQISDSDEVVLATRNARVADLPAPTIEIGEINLQLDVRFTETTSVQTRELENRTVNSTLTQSSRQEFSNMNSNSQEAFGKFSVGTEYSVGDFIFKPGGQFKTNVAFEGGWTGNWTSKATATSSTETQNAYQESLTTDEELTEGASVARSVDGAKMQATVTIENASGLAYTIRNLQLTAFIQDPLDPTLLKPIATLVPDNEPDDGFNLGPLVPARGPLIFSNDQIFPTLVENLMKNPRGLVFAISNYDITDELGRNFAFSSQEVVERTAALVIDFGSYDSDGDNEGDLTEYHRIATGSGRAVDESDQRIVFDANGDQVGITLRDALDAVGLTQFDEQDTPTTSLSDDEIQSSYSTIIDDAGVERIYRIRRASVEPGVPKAWEVLTATGIDQTIGVDDFVLKTEDDIKLSFVQDVDQDRMVASVEFIHNCSDALADTDTDGLDDRMESLIGWEIQTSSGSRQVFSRCSMADTDLDGLTDAEEAGAMIDCGTDGVGDVSWMTDPGTSDTDADGIADREEICGYSITPRATGVEITVFTDPTDSDTDGDTAPDGIERDLRGNPTDAGDIDQFADYDGDGLVNYQEDEGWDITVYGVSYGENQDIARCLSVCDEGDPTIRHISSDPYNGDTDGDGLSDLLEFEKTDARNSDTDGDGLTDAQEYFGFEMRDQGIIVLNPSDADTDNDKRSDGDEAELEDLITTQWIVRVVGEEPYRVYSDPRYPDSDFDTLVDGDENDYGTDPLVGNTDGDRRDDAVEAGSILNPLQVDVMVTVLYRSVTVDLVGELWDPVLACFAARIYEADGSQCGDADFAFMFNVRLPDDSTATGLAPTHRQITNEADIGQFLPECVNHNDITDQWRHVNTPCTDYDSFDADGIKMSPGRPLQLFRSDYNIPLVKRQFTFSLTEDQRFSIEGQVGEYDHHVGDSTYHWLYFGGLEGISATQNGSSVLAVFEGKDVISQTIENVTFEFSHPDWNNITNVNSILLDNPFLQVSPASGKVEVMYIID